MAKNKQKKMEVAVVNRQSGPVKSFDFNNPSQMVAMASVLKKHILQYNLFTDISGKNYVHVEGWQFAGGMLGIMPLVTSTDDISKTPANFKYRASVDLINMKTGNIVGKGSAICSNTENKKKSFDEYAVMSMAQTRAIGKAYRNTIGWVMKLAGYEGTPSEEMTKMGEQPSAPKTHTNDSEFMKECNICGEPISDAGAKFSMNLYGKYLCKTHAAEAKPLKRK